MTIEWKLRELLAKSMQRKSDKFKVTFTKAMYCNLVIGSG